MRTWPEVKFRKSETSLDTGSRISRNGPDWRH